MSVMQIAHGGDKSYVALASQPGAQSFNGGNDFHVPDQNECSGPGKDLVFTYFT
jgi:hypothetical protein